MSQVNMQGISGAVLQNLMSFLGKEVYDAVIMRLSKDYFDGDTDIRKVIDHQPELFEAV